MRTEPQGRRENARNSRIGDTFVCLEAAHDSVAKQYLFHCKFFLNITENY